MNHLPTICPFPFPGGNSENDKYSFQDGLNRGSYMSAHVLSNLLNEIGKKIRC